MRTLVLARNEFIKTRRRVAFWVAFGGFAGLLAMVFAGMHYQGLQRPDHPHPFALPGAWTEILGGPGPLSAFFASMALVLLVASEFTWRTARQNVIDGLSKEEFFAAKLLLLPVIGIAFFAALLLIGGGIALGGTHGAAEALVRGADARFMGGALIGLFGWIALAFLLATTIRSSGPAIGVFFLYFLVEQIVGQLVARIGPAWATAMRYLPAAIFKALWQPQSYSAPRTFPGGPPPIEVATLMWTGAAYVALFLLAAFILYRRRDL
jgi:ABC-type transport system involved in multi-copper enzyme maturation permease subunit